jgi:ParB family chromosome partitioning protein
MSQKPNKAMNDINMNKYNGAFDGVDISINNNKSSNKQHINEYNISNIEGAVQVQLTHNIIDNIDFEDKTFILRDIDFQKYLEDENIKALSNSIYSVGLINPVYIQKRNDGKYRIISGFRRLTAIYSGIITSGSEYEFDGEVIIVPEVYTKEDLDTFQVNENTHRENLKPLELAQRIYDASENYSIPIEEIGEQYNLGARQILKLKGILNYPTPLKEKVNEIGVSSSDLINRIIKYKKLTEENNLGEIKSLVDELKDFTKSELEKYLKDLKAKKNKQNIEIKSSAKVHQLKINASLTMKELEDICKYINNIINNK